MKANTLGQGIVCGFILLIRRLEQRAVIHSEGRVFALSYGIKVFT
jgi:hypothetical protein